jgi:hypothetical protein
MRLLFPRLIERRRWSGAQVDKAQLLPPNSHPFGKKTSEWV